jgi:FlaA1/EpsC-like NDP-sugar epimerase
MKRDWALLFRRAMPLLDFGLVVAAFALAYTLRYDSPLMQALRPVEESSSSPFDIFLPYAALFGLWLILTWPVAALYREQRGRAWLEEVWRLANGATNAAVVVMAVSFILQPLGFSRLLIVLAAALVIVLLSGERLIYRILRATLRSRGVGVERVLLIGADEVGRAVLSAILARPDLGYTPIGFLDDDPERGSVDMGRVRGLGDLSKLRSLLTQRAVDLVIITLPWTARTRIMDMVDLCAYHNVSSRIVPDLFQLSMSQVHIENLEGIPLLGLRNETTIDRSRYSIKRFIDLTVILALRRFCCPSWVWCQLP